MTFMGRPTKLDTILSLSAGVTETSLRNRDLIEKAYRDQLGGNDTAIWDLLHPDVTFWEAPSLPYGHSAKGIEATKAGVQSMLEAWSHMRVEIFDFATSGDIVIAYIRMTATSRATGKVYDAPVAELFRFRDSKIIEWRPIYWDTHLVREICGIR